MHLIAGGSDTEQARDGDFTDHDARYRRMQEYVTLLKRTWTEPTPFHHQGEFYRVSGAYAEIRCQQAPHMPIYGGGGSPAAIEALAPVVDVYMLWGEPLQASAAFMEEVRAVARRTQHRLTFSLSTRPILGRTEGEAWDRARRMLARIKARQQGMVPIPQNMGSLRLLDAAAENEVHDSCLWTALAALTGARGNSTALVGTPETVAEALVAYYDLGATSLLIRGYDPLAGCDGIRPRTHSTRPSPGRRARCGQGFGSLRTALVPSVGGTGSMPRKGSRNNLPRVSRPQRDSRNSGL